MPPYSIVIPTTGRTRLLEGVLQSITQQTHRPVAVHVVDAGKDTVAAEFCRIYRASVPLSHEAAEVMSAACQRNQGARHVTAPVVVFCDDDMSFGPDTMAVLVGALAEGPNPPGGAAARIEGLSHPQPRRILRAYYRWQAGYDHAHYGARLFGPAINCWPCYERETRTVIPADWLNSALVAYRRDVFQAEQFPQFDGYSFMEDVHLSARVARRHGVVFHRQACCIHHGEDTSHRRLRPDLVAMEWRNRALIARTILRTSEDRLRAQLRAHRAFVALHLARHRPAGWKEELGALLRLPSLV